MPLDHSRVTETTILGHRVRLMDAVDSGSTGIIIGEFERDNYNIRNRKLPEGSIVFDLGANIGIFSILIAKLNPNIRVYAFEPTLINYHHLRWNLCLNGLYNVTAFPFAVTKNGQPVQMQQVGADQSWHNYGGVTAKPWTASSSLNKADSVTFKQIFEKLVPTNATVSFAKVDCEGCEYDVFDPENYHLLDRIEFIAGEFHSMTDREHHEAIYAAMMNRYGNKSVFGVL
jgi:FkbM family methyltransferase